MPTETKEYFIVANSFAAPVFSDTSEHFVVAQSPESALEQFAKDYKHPCGLYSAVCYADANAYHKCKKGLAKWLCNHEAEKQRLTGNRSYSYLGHGPGDFEIDGKRHRIKNPKAGSVR